MAKTNIVTMAVGLALSLATIYAVAYFAGKGWDIATDD